MIKNKLAVAVAATFLIGAMGTAFAVDGDTTSETETTVITTGTEGSTETETAGTEGSTETETAGTEGSTETETAGTEGSTETETAGTEGSTETETASSDEENIHLGQAQSSLEKNLEAQPENQGLMNALSHIFTNQERHAARFDAPESVETDSTSIESSIETETASIRPERPERPERAERPERPERPERAERPERPERPEHPEHP